MSQTHTPHGKLLTTLAAALLIVSSFLPWGSFESQNITTNISGIAEGGDGRILVVVGIITLTLLLIKRVKIWIPIALGLFALTIGVADYLYLQDLNAESGPAQTAYGLYLILVAGIFLILGPIISIIQKKKAEEKVDS